MDRGIKYIIDPDVTLGRVLRMVQSFDKIEKDLIDTTIQKKELEDKLKAIKELLETEYTKEQIIEIISR